MTSLTIFAALNVPTVTSYPSTTCLQWSADGQLCFTTKTAAYIMTPDHGINFDIASVIKSSLEKDIREDQNALGWFRTIVQLEKSEASRWPEFSQEWGAASLGSIDVTLWAVVFSPSSLSPDAGCVLACLSSNMDLSLWASSKNCLKGEWIKIYEVTPFLLETYGPPAEGNTNQTLKSQVVSILWTTQADFGVTPTPRVNGSFLIAGNRAGSLIFLRYDKAKIQMDLVETISVSNKWITHIAFSGWITLKQRSCEGYVAYGCSDGSVGLVKVVQSLKETPSIFPFGPHFSIETVLTNAHNLLYEADKSGITGMKWIDVPNSKILVHCKPGVVHLHSPSSSTGSEVWTGYRKLNLVTQHISTASSAFHAVSCIHYDKGKDKLILALCDGSFHVIGNFSRSPEWVTESTPDNGVSSEGLSKAAREAFVKTEAGDVDKDDVNRITGAVEYDREVYLWAHESTRPSDFSYKHDARHNSTLVAAQLWEDGDDESFLQELSNLLNNVKTTSGLVPLNLLRPYFFRYRDSVKLNSLFSQILSILHNNPTNDYSTLIHFPTYTDGELTTGLRKAFRQSLATHLFGWDTMLSLRLRLSLADFVWKHCDSEEKQNSCGQIAQGLLSTISHCTLRTIIRHLTSVENVLTASDVPFVLRMVVQSMLPGSPPDLAQEAQNLSSAVQSLILQEADPAAQSNQLHELCPACRIEVPLENITDAVCPNGHTWARCSITTFILSTTSVRTCIGCSRKAFLPPSAGEQNIFPGVARGWIVEELLEAADRCLFCNNSFVSLL